MDHASEDWFGLPSVSIGCGGSIPFMEFLANKYPQAEFVVTGVLGPHSNAHGPNEFLHLPTVKKITGCVASIIEKWADR
jgi:acetylornithine deacetylase/succinyl-diaminopimelate desuccinylase-like protein